MWYEDRGRAVLYSKNSAPEDIYSEAVRRLSAKSLDGVIFSGPCGDPAEFQSILLRYSPFLADQGMMVIFVENAFYWRTVFREEIPKDLPPKAVQALLEQSGYAIYMTLPRGDEAEERPFPDEAGDVFIDGRRVPCDTPKVLESLLTIDYVLVAARRGYDPLAHARSLRLRGEFERGYQVLSLAPGSRIGNPARLAESSLELLRCLAGQLRVVPPVRRLETFALAQAAFYTAVVWAPERIEAYLEQAEVWQQLGNADMAGRILRSIQYVTPSAAVTAALGGIEGSPAGRSSNFIPPEWTSPGRIRRVLMLGRAKAQFDQDTLCDGFCRVLGRSNVRVYPITEYDSQAPDLFYPQRFTGGTEQEDLDRLEAELRENRFDLMISCDIEFSADADAVQRLVNAGKGIPFCVVDLGDSCADHLAEVLKRLGRNEADAYFKREMLTSGQYSPHTFPCPLAYPDSLLPPAIEGERTIPVFWAGARNFGLRRLYLEYLERRAGIPCDPLYTLEDYEHHIVGVDYHQRASQEEYRTALLSARIGLSCFGCGFDTLRYWELPAHGAMLLAERPPIHIPYNFEDAVSAVYFDDLRELEEKLRYYLSHAEEAAEIARAGRIHLERHHTGAARARQLLGWMERILEQTATT